MKITKWFVVVTAMAALGITGCQSKQAPTPSETGQGSGQVVEGAPSPATPEAVAKTDETAPVPAAPAEAEKAPFVHDPSNPPVDCPLRKAGLDPTKVKPFEQTEMYIQFLERPDRAEWQKPEEVVDAMGLTGSEHVFDLGSGSGYFTFPMAKRLKNGHVYAGDVEPEMIRHIHHKSMLENIQNVEVKFIDSAKPEIPNDVDIIFMCDVLHHVPNPVEWLTHISNQMKAGSRFYMIEFHEGDIPQGPPESAKIPKDKIISYAQEAGLKLNREIENILPYQVFLEFTK